MAGRAQLRRGPQSESDGLALSVDTAPKRLSIFPEESAAWSRDSSFTQQVPVVSKKKAKYIVVVAVVIVTIHHQVLNRRLTGCDLFRVCIYFLFWPDGGGIVLIPNVIYLLLMEILWIFIDSGVEHVDFWFISGGNC